MRNIKNDITNSNSKINENDELYLPIPFSSALKVIENEIGKYLRIRTIRKKMTII